MWPMLSENNTVVVIIGVFVVFHIILFIVGFHWLTTTDSGWAKPPEDAEQVVAAGERVLSIDGTEKGSNDVAAIASVSRTPLVCDGCCLL